MSEWWNVGMVECWNGGMLEWWNVGMVECWNGGMLEWWNGGMSECRNTLKSGVTEFPKTRNASLKKTKI